MHNLPPLPEKEQIDKHIQTGIVIRGYTSDQMQTYAIKAVNDVLAGLEANMVAADMRINDMKNTGELRQREDHAALVAQVLEGS